MLLGAANPAPNPFPFLVESSSQQQRWLPRPASPVVSSSSSQQHGSTAAAAITRQRRPRHPHPRQRASIHAAVRPSRTLSAATRPSARPGAVFPGLQIELRLAAVRADLHCRRLSRLLPAPPVVAPRTPLPIRAPSAFHCCSRSFAARVRVRPVDAACRGLPIRPASAAAGAVRPSSSLLLVAAARHLAADGCCGRLLRPSAGCCGPFPLLGAPSVCCGRGGVRLLCSGSRPPRPAAALFWQSASACCCSVLVIVDLLFTAVRSIQLLPLQFSPWLKSVLLLLISLLMVPIIRSGLFVLKLL